MPSQRHPTGHIGTIFPLLRCETGTAEGSAGSSGARSLLLSMALFFSFFYPALKGIRSAHRAFIKDTLCVNGRQLKSSSPLPTLPANPRSHAEPRRWADLCVARSAGAACPRSGGVLNGMCTSHTRRARTAKMPLEHTPKHQK